jgi:D-alanyl-D-alanine carboxypeptidase
VDQRVFAELLESVNETLEHAHGKRELRTTELPLPPKPVDGGCRKKATGTARVGASSCLPSEGPMTRRSGFALMSIAVLVLGLVACNGRANVNSPAVGGARPRVNVPAINVGELDRLTQRVFAEKRLVGLSVGVMQDGKVVFTKGYGFRSLDPKEPVTPTTIFPIGSVTKQFTCSAALLLAQDGKLSMRDPVTKYVPTATRAGDVTLLDLGQHVSGYRDYYPLDFVDREMQRPATADAIIAEYATRALDFEPGTRWSYSNTNFLILGKAIETAAGEGVGAFLTQRIFARLGMTRTAYDPPATDTGRAKGYTSYALAAPTLARPEADGWTGAAGAIWSTPSDLLKWDLALMDGKVLSAASYAVLTTPRTLVDGRSTGYGCGIGVQSGGSALVLRHGGAVAGSVTQNIFIPSTRSAIVLFANADFAATEEIIDSAIAKLSPQVDVPKIAGPPALEAATAFLTSLEQGRVDRATLGDDFNALLTPEHVARDRASLASYGRIRDVRIARTLERGGMEVAVVEFKVGTIPAASLMYRTPDGKIQQLLINRR